MAFAHGRVSLHHSETSTCERTMHVGRNISSEPLRPVQSLAVLETGNSAVLLIEIYLVSDPRILCIFSTVGNELHA